MLLHLQLQGGYKGFGDDVLATSTINYQVAHFLVDGATSLEDVVLLRFILVLRC